MGKAKAKTLPSNDLYRYLQIRHYVIKNRELEHSSRKPTNIEFHFIHLFEQLASIKKQISDIKTCQ